MRNVLRIFVRDVKRIAHVWQAWLVVIFLTILPSLYTWFNVAGFWDPYENTGNLRVCVVDEDVGSTDDTLGDIDLGSQIVSQLRENKQLGWDFTDKQEALDAVYSGQAYAAFVIPESFSEEVVALTRGEIQRPKLDYYVNEKTGPVAPKITDTGANALDSTINEAFFSAVSSTVAQLLDDEIASVRNDVEKTRNDALQSMDSAIEKVSAAQDSVMHFEEKLNDVDTAISNAQHGLSGAKDKLAEVSGLLDQSGIATDSASEKAMSFALTISSVFDSASTEISSTSEKTTGIVGKASSAVESVCGFVDSSYEVGKQALKEYDNVLAGLKKIEASLDKTQDGSSKISELIGDLESRNDKANESLETIATLSSDTAATAQSMSEASSSINEAVKSAISGADTYRDSLSDKTFPALMSGVNQLSSSMRGLAASVAAQTVLVDQASSVLDELRTSLGLARDALSSTGSLLATFAEEASVVRTDISALGTSETIDKLFGDGQIDPEKVADFMMSPTKVETERLYPLNAYGSAMAPLFINLTLWIGVFMLMIIFRLEVDNEGVPDATIAQRVFGRLILLGSIASLQAIVCCVGCMVIGVQTVNPALFIVTAILISLSYLGVQYTLSTTLQHVGMAMCIVLVFVQIPAATGLYPVEMLPEFFTAVYPAFPFTYGINAMREVIAGMYGMTWAKNIGVLMAFLVSFVCIGMLIRPYVTNLNRMFARQIEESGIINGEVVLLPDRRYGISQIIGVLTDRDEFKQEIVNNMERFMHRYALLKRVGIIVGVAVPIVTTAVFALLGVEKVVTLTFWLIWLVVSFVFLIVVEFFKDKLGRQLSLEKMSDEEVRNLFMKSAKRVEHRSAADAGPNRGNEDSLSEGGDLS